MSGCLPDSAGTDWFACAHGTVGCPRIHASVTPHCIACAGGEPCRFDHDPPVLAESVEDYYARIKPEPTGEGNSPDVSSSSFVGDREQTK